MEIRSLKFLFFLLIISASDSAGSEKSNNSPLIYDSYFPANRNATLVYNSSFGESRSRFIENGEFTISSNEGEKFKYIQTLMINEEGVYIKETYQFVKIFLFLKKEADFRYSKPLLRIPFPLVPGKEWHSEGEEYSDGDTTHVMISGKVIAREQVKTPAGLYEAIKIETRIEDSKKSTSTVTEWYSKEIGLVKAEIVTGGGGLMGIVRNLLGYGTITFELKGIIKD